VDDLNIRHYFSALISANSMPGKPDPAVFLEAALNLMDLRAADCLMTGDRLETDVNMGQEACMSTALTLTGAAPESALAGSSIRPTCVLHHLSDLLP
jgi:arabinose operon protein AraL